jgi:hypothetical protein
VAAAAVPAQVGQCVAGWQEQPVPDVAFISTPFDVITRDGQPAWVVGGANVGVMTLRWNGSAWQRAAGVSRGHRGLVGGVAVGARKVLAVGYYRPFGADDDSALVPMSGRVSGAAWKDLDVPRPPGPRATLTDVASLGGNDAWAVGTRLDGGRLRAWAARLHGARWTRDEPATRGGSGLLAIDRAPSGELWAVGWQERRAGQPRPYIASLRGGRWRSVTPPGLPDGTAVLTDVDMRGAREGWAVGYLVPKRADRHIAFLLRWDGRRWSRRPLPWANEVAAVPRSVSAGEDGRVWIGGTQTANDQREARGFVASGTGESWSVDVLGVPADVRSEVMDVAATSQGAVAAANVGASLLVLHTCQASAAPAAKARSKATSKARERADAKTGRIRVSHMKARRRAREVEDVTALIEGESAAVPVPFAIAARRKPVRLRAPVPPSGFVVQDVAATTGLAHWTLTFDGFAADFDGNGYRDVFYSRHGNQMPRLAMNGGGTFSDAPTDAFSPVDRHGCDSADVDNDGNRDILCAVGAARGKAVKRHELSFAPDKPGGRLARDTRGISDPLGRGRDIGFIHLDRDPFPEVFISDAPDRDDGMPGHNRFYRNVGGTFVPAPTVGLDTSHSAACIETGDLDRDGDEDLAYCAAYGFGGRDPGLRFMRNERGRLRDRTLSIGLRPIGDVDIAFADVAGDGGRAAIQLAPERLRVSRWTGRGYRTVYEARLTSAVAIGAGDANGDGAADLYVVRGDGNHANQPDLLLISQAGGRRWLSVQIPQTRQGSADDVIALDFDRNGLSDFVVLNGRRREGPIQLLAAFPA